MRSDTLHVVTGIVRLQTGAKGARNTDGGIGLFDYRHFLRAVDQVRVGANLRYRRDHFRGQPFAGIGEIFKFAVITELVNRNPVADLDSALKARRPGHNAWLQISEIPPFYKALERAGSVQIQTAIRLLILTALRTAELRLMRWEWVDLESATITLPAEVMKARRPHVVPLSRQAVELLQDQFTRSGYSAFVFPGRFMDKPLSASAILKALERIGYKALVTGHGWRTTFSTALNESGRYSPDWIEIQLAHVPKGIRGVYNQAAYLKQRRAMMQSYADAIDSILAGDGNPLEP